MENTALDTSTISLVFAIALIVGCGLGFAFYKLLNYTIRKQAQEEAQEILDEVKEEVELRLLEEKERTQEIETELWTKAEPELMKSEERIEDLEAIVEEKKNKADNILKEEQKKSAQREGEVKSVEKVVHEKEKVYQSKKDALTDLNKKLVEALSHKSNVSVGNIKQEITQQLLKEADQAIAKSIESYETDLKEHLETHVKKILDVVFDRFAREYCPERGIAPVDLPEEAVLKLFNTAENIKTMVDLTGCDITIEEGMTTVGVAGFDPVRRELTRRTLERVFKEKRQINPDFIKKCFENCKRELLNMIKKDGDNLVKELRLDNMHPEIKQMMGSLRYRYSFTQNQYFHCAEVGWIAGLIASEMDLDIRKARRSGMLHDLGKAMDHAMDGGHAVIGADFIEARGEKPDIVHAVRSHHYDEQPSTEHAFLVIAADAISGARPGARRSTMESYTQKITELENIAKSFTGVTECYILSGGRECRVIANGKQLSDIQCLELSKKIAQRIENECNYPGQIKVVVVRETLISESTRQLA